MRTVMSALILVLSLAPIVPIVPISQITPIAQARSDEAPEARTYRTRRVESGPPATDGWIDDAAWDLVEWSGGFLQRIPCEGEPPAAQTEFKMLYDDDAVYFAFRMYDDPAEVRSILARHDWFPGDWVEVNIDSYFDHRTAFSFTLSCSGTRGDAAISDARDSRKSPARIACRLPHLAFTVSTPRRVSASSITSSW